MTNQRERRSLIPADITECPVLVQKSLAPVLRDDWINGFDYICGHCGQSVLAECVVEDQLWGIAFRCVMCNGISKTPNLQPGMALPPNVVVISQGNYNISGTVDMKRSAMASETTIKQRENEVGKKGSTFGRFGGQTRSFNESFLVTLIDSVRDFIGPAFDKLDLSDRLAQASVTRPRQRHPLMAAVSGVRKALNTMSKPNPIIDIRPITELYVLVQLLERWKNHPVWPKLVQGLANEYPHTLVTLAAATLLEDLGNGVVLHESSFGRAADLLLVASPQKYSYCEVKVPAALRHREKPLEDEEAKRIVEKAVKRAGTGKKGQLSRENSGILIIGGSHLSDSQLDSMERASQQYLDSSSKRGYHLHLMGIAIVSIGTTVEFKTTNIANVDRKVHGTVTIRTIKNSGYAGELNWVTTT